MLVVRASEEIDTQQWPAFEIERTLALFAQALVELSFAPVLRVLVIEVKLNAIRDSLNRTSSRTGKGCSQHCMAI